MQFYVDDNNNVWSENDINESFAEFVDECYPEPVVILGINFYASSILEKDDIAYRQERMRWMTSHGFLKIDVPWELSLIEGGVDDYISNHPEALSDDL
jgi:hypothetical protein